MPPHYRQLEKQAYCLNVDVEPFRIIWSHENPPQVEIASSRWERFYETECTKAYNTDTNPCNTVPSTEIGNGQYYA